MKNSEIAKKCGVSKSFVTQILSGERNPVTAKGIQVLMMSAEIQAQIFKAEYIAHYLRKWKLRETLKHKH